MRKLIAVLTIVMFVFTAGLAVAGGAGQDKDGAGYYQHSVTGKIKYFDSHPKNPSQWRLIGDEPGPGPGPGPGPCDGCGDTQTFFNGDASQFSGVNIEFGNLKFDDENMYKKGSGAMAYGTEESSASYYGVGDGLGLALAFGGTFMYGGEFTDLLGGEAYGVVGATGNISIAAVGNPLGYEQPVGCATIEGSGEMGTFAAVKNSGTLAAASSNGSFAYQGSTPNGIVVGGGLTGGGSGAGVGTNHAWAASGQVTISGVGGVCDGVCGDYGYID